MPPWKSNITPFVPKDERIRAQARKALNKTVIGHMLHGWQDLIKFTAHIEMPGIPDETITLSHYNVMAFMRDVTEGLYDPILSTDYTSHKVVRVWENGTKMTVTW